MSPTDRSRKTQPVVGTYVAGERVWRYLAAPITIVRGYVEVMDPSDPPLIAPRPVDVADPIRQVVRKAEGISGADVTTGPTANVVAALDPEPVTQATLQLAQVFHRFYRDTEGRESSSGSGLGLGLGLGLNIVQVIARAHGRTTRVEDADGGGAMFVIALPLRRPVAPPMPASARGSGAQPRATAQPGLRL